MGSMGGSQAGAVRICREKSRWSSGGQCDVLFLCYIPKSARNTCRLNSLRGESERNEREVRVSFVSHCGSMQACTPMRCLECG